MTASAAAEGMAPVDSLWRAMSATRMLDAGMEYGDVLGLERLTRQDGVAWDIAAEQLADAHLERSREAEEAGHALTALEAARAAVACLVFAQMAFNFDVPRKRDLYTRLTDTMGRVSRLSEDPIDRVVLPFAKGSLFGWLLRPPGPVGGTVILFGGQSGWGPAYLKQAGALARRGIATLLAEGPGQGEARLEGEVLLDVDVRAAYSRFVDEVTVTPGLGSGVGLWGNSLGGLYAATTAASDPRVTAVCVNGAPARPRLLEFRAFAEQAAAMLGSNDPRAVQANFDRIALRPEDRITASLLVLHGGDDPIVSLVEQRPFLHAATGEATLREWADGEHTIYNHAEERTALVADWFADSFRREG